MKYRIFHCFRAVYLTARQYHHGLGGLAVDKSHALELYRTAMKQGLEEATEAFHHLEQELLADREEKHPMRDDNVEVKISPVKEEPNQPASGSILEQKFKKFGVRLNFSNFHFHIFNGVLPDVKTSETVFKMRDFVFRSE